MSLERVGISLRYGDVAPMSRLTEDLEMLHVIGSDFVELCPQGLGIIVGGQLNWSRIEEVRPVLDAADIGYTVHPPLRLNLMDLDRLELQRSILESSIAFAGETGASIVVCHAGVRDNRRHARHSFTGQLDTERNVLRELGDLAGELGVTIAVENWCPIEPLINGTHYTYSVWPSELATQVAEVDHPSVGVCLDVGHAFVASTFHEFDFLAECASVAPLVRHVHLHDNLGMPETVRETEPTERLSYGIGDLHMPPGKGQIPLEELFAKVKFPRADTCCVELPSGTPRVVTEEAIDDARTIVGLAREGVSA